MKSHSDIIKELRRPFTPEAVQFKIQSAKSENALIVAYVDSRQVNERLNLVCPEQWSDAYTPLEVPGGGLGGLLCEITIRAGSSLALTRGDVGIMEGGIGGIKAVASDAFKRAGVKWGIGVPLYYTPKCFVKRSILKKGGDKYFMSPQAEKEARKQYSDWLKSAGIERFGEPLDLGDLTSDQGDIEVHPEQDDSLPEADEPRQTEIDESDFEELPAEGVDPKEEVRAAFRDYVARSSDPAKAKNRFGLWLTSKGIPQKIVEMDSEQLVRTHEWLTGQTREEE